MVVMVKLAPIVGAATVTAAVFQMNAESPWSTLWRLGISILLGVFVTLVGAIYQNLNRRLGSLEGAAKSDFVPRVEYDRRHEDLLRQLDRIEDALRRTRN